MEDLLEKAVWARKWCRPQEEEAQEVEAGDKHECHALGAEACENSQQRSEEEGRAESSQTEDPKCRWAHSYSQFPQEKRFEEQWIEGIEEAGCAEGCTLQIDCEADCVSACEGQISGTVERRVGQEDRILKLGEGSDCEHEAEVWKDQIQGHLGRGAGGRPSHFGTSSVGARDGSSRGDHGRLEAGAGGIGGRVNDGDTDKGLSGFQTPTRRPQMFSISSSPETPEPFFDGRLECEFSESPVFELGGSRSLGDDEAIENSTGEHLVKQLSLLAELGYGKADKGCDSVSHDKGDIDVGSGVPQEAWMSLCAATKVDGELLAVVAKAKVVLVQAEGSGGGQWMSFTVQLLLRVAVEQVEGFERIAAQIEALPECEMVAEVVHIGQEVLMQKCWWRIVGLQYCKWLLDSISANGESGSSSESE